MSPTDGDASVINGEFTQAVGSCGARGVCYAVQQADGSCCADDSVRNVLKELRLQDESPGSREMRHVGKVPHEPQSMVSAWSLSHPRKFSVRQL